MNFFEFILRKLAVAQDKYGAFILIVSLIFTLVMGYGMTQIEFSGDINEEMPQHLPVYRLTDRISDKFGGQDVMFILIQLDDSLELKSVPKDIREPEIMAYLVQLENALDHESSINNIISLAPMVTMLQEYDILTKEMITDSIRQNPQTSALVNDKYTMTLMIIYSDVGTGQKKVVQLTDLIEEKIKGLSVPSGVKVTVTGTPSIISTILDLLKKDAVFTLVLASFIILILLFVVERSFTKGFLIFTPIMLGLVWTLGTMGYLGIKINVATAGLGAMILGLGVEYGVFMLTRYKEERDKGKSQSDSIIIAVPSVGNAVLGSGITTIVGFLALTLSIMPMLQHLGQSLALGIAYCIVAAVVVEPILIIIEEKFEYWYTHKKHYTLQKKKDSLRKRA